MTRQLSPGWSRASQPRSSGVDIAKPLTPGRRRRHPWRHGQVRRPGVPRPADRRRAAARVHAAASASIEHAIGTGLRAPQRVSPAHRLSPTCPTSTRTTNRSPRDDRRRLFGLGNRAVAFRQLVQGGPGQVLAAARAQRHRPRAATPSSPTCARPTTRSTRRPRRWSRTWCASTQQLLLPPARWVSPTSPRRSASSFEPVRQRLVAAPIR